jgi:MFS family permease
MSPPNQSPTPARRSPLRKRAFRRLWLGGLVSDLGDWTLLVALPVAVFELTGSALTTSTVFVVELLAGLLAGQLGGVLVDRWDRRRLLVATAVIQAVALLPLLVVTSADQLAIVFVVAAVQSGLARLSGPAKTALVPTLVEADQLAAANGLSATADNLARLVGSPLGGLAIALVGLPGVVLIDAVTFLAAAASFAGVRRTTAGRGTTGHAGVDQAGTGGDGTPVESLGAAWIDGLRVIRRDPRLATVLGIAALSQLAQGIFIVLFVVFVLEALHGSGTEVGLLRGVQAIGGILGGLLVARLARRLGPRMLIGGGFLAFGVLSFVTWNLPPVTTAIGIYAALFVLAGIPGVATATGLLTTVQTLTPGTHLGRVVAAFEAGAALLAAVGVLLAGALADSVGTIRILDVQAGIYVLCGVLALIALRPRSERSTSAMPSATPT